MCFIERNSLVYVFSPLVVAQYVASGSTDGDTDDTGTGNSENSNAINSQTTTTSSNNNDNSNSVPMICNGVVIMIAVLWLCL